MTKGGPRVASDIMPVGKGMGLEQHYQTLKMIEKMGKTNLLNLMIELNKKFGWWDDPTDPKKKGPTETCRSYIKELWRLGLLDRVDEQDQIIECNAENWNGRKKQLSKLSELGKFVLKQQHKHFPYYVAWCILKTVDNKLFPQCYKLFKLLDLDKKIPVSDPETSDRTRKHGIYVEKHANKTIKFGWLESTGLIYRPNRQYFKLNEKFKKYLQENDIKDILIGIEHHIDNEKLSVLVTPAYLGYTGFERHKKYKIEVNFENKSKNKINIQLKCIPSSVFQYISEFIISKDSFSLPAKKTRKITITLISNSFDVSNSFGLIMCGFLNVIVDDEPKSLYLPSLVLAKKDRVWERTILDKFEELGLITFHFGKSDRPDGVIDLSGLRVKPDNVLEYLRDEKKEKMLMETTMGTYHWAKRIADTQTPSKKESKYASHTSKVLKIRALGQIISAEEFEVANMFAIIEEKREHIITFVTMRVLDYMINKKKETGNGYAAITKILKSNKMVDVVDVNDAFEEL